ncbi:MAG: hypothetical protein A2Y33_05035 [Spirochaetes bacterium GWF1_51_8]|nr:MAG: hypothetical protein A2Y33_05035 [Spirochaetes bacterium GWF1_51_8]
MKQKSGYKARKDLTELIQVMTSLTSEHNLEKLLKLIVKSAVDITDSDAASLYLREKDFLKFVITTNKTLEARMGREVFESTIKAFSVLISKKSISGFAAHTGKIVNIKDVYKIKEKPYSFNKTFDEINQYRSKSMLTIPLVNREGNVVGVLQLINKLTKKGKLTTFKKYDEEVTISLGAQAAVALENVKLQENLLKSHYDSIMRLSAANEFRDNETGFHVQRVSYYCELLAKAAGYSEDFVKSIKYASPLHDVGKIGIPDKILKKPGRLTEEEYEIMKQHTVIGGKILSNSDNDIMLLAQEVALSHHEKWDGTGYPYGLKTENIPLSGRITAIADVFDALSNKRVYKPAFPLDKTFSILEEESGIHFDPKLIEVFLSVKDDVEDIYKRLKDED